MDIGGELRRARTARQLSIAELSRRTKISPAVLTAMETNQFGRVPGGLFTRAFLRTYAREVGLDPDATVQQYRAEFEAPDTPEPEQTHPAARTPDPDLDSTAPPGEERGPSQAIGLAVVILIGIVYFGFERHRTTADAAPRATDTAVAATAAAGPVATSGSVTTAGTTAPAQSLKMELRATGDCWISASVDGESALSRLMTAGERQQFEAWDEVAMRVGDPGTLQMTINGVPAKPLGPEGAPVNAKITLQNYKSFLQAR